MTAANPTGSTPSTFSHWEFASTWTNHAAALRSIPWQALEGYPGAEPLKRSPTRQVWRVPLAERFVVAKIYFDRRPTTRIKHAVLGPPGRQEFAAASYAAERRLDVLRPVAWARGGRGGPHVFISESLGPVTPLSRKWLDLRQDPGARHDLTRCSARLLGALHAANFVPHDVHAENILVADHAEIPARRLTLVDLHRARWGQPVTAEQRVANLADLHQWFQHHACSTDQLRFLMTYWSIDQRRPDRRIIRQLITRVETLASRRSRQLANKRDSRIYGDNAFVGRVQLADGWHGHVFLRGPRAGNGSALDHCQFSREEWVAALPTLLEDPPESRWNRNVRVGTREIPTTCHRAERDADLLREHWEQAHHRLNRHQATPLPLALLERRSSSGTEWVLVMENDEHGTD